MYLISLGTTYIPVARIDPVVECLSTRMASVISSSLEQKLRRVCYFEDMLFGQMIGHLFFWSIFESFEKPVSGLNYDLIVAANAIKLFKCVWLVRKN